MTDENGDIYPDDDDIIDLDPQDALKDPHIERPVWRESNGNKIDQPQLYSQQKRRTIVERERDLTFIAELYVKGYTQADIAEELSKARDYSIGRTQIWKDIQLIHKRWMEAYILPVNELKVRELARLDRLENEYWDAWERSKRDITSLRQDTIRDRSPSGSETYNRNKTILKKDERDGSVAFLQGIERCIDKRCQILGLDAAKSVTINWRKQAAAEGIDPDEVVSELTEQFIAMAGRGLPGSVGESPETDQG